PCATSRGGRRKPHTRLGARFAGAGGGRSRGPRAGYGLGAVTRTTIPPTTTSPVAIPLAPLARATSADMLCARVAAGAGAAPTVGAATAGAAGAGVLTGAAAPAIAGRVNTLRSCATPSPRN